MVNYLFKGGSCRFSISFFIAFPVFFYQTCARQMCSNIASCMFFSSSQMTWGFKNIVVKLNFLIHYHCHFQTQKRVLCNWPLMVLFWSTIFTPQSLWKQAATRIFSKNACSVFHRKKIKSYRFRMTCRWINDVWIFIFSGLTYPLTWLTLVLFLLFLLSPCWLAFTLTS